MRRFVVTHFFAVIATVLCALALTYVPAAAASTQCDTYSGTNVNDQNYSTYGSTVGSYLIATSDGQLMRFQKNAISGSYLVEYYDQEFNLQKTVKVAQELSIFGAFYDDGSNYYVLSGQENADEDDSVEVYRITKYDHNWKRIGSAGLYGANTYIPFDAGSARMTSDGDLLFIRTCHEMYQSADGYHHQANVTIEVDTSSMTVVDSYYSVMNVSYGYVSHSFNQFIRLDNGYIVGVDHGDAYPRAVVLQKYKSAYTSSGFKKNCNYTNMLSISGAAGKNATGVSVGGFEISSDHYLVAGNTVDMGDSYSASGTRNIFVSSVDRSLSTTPTVHYITSYAAGETSAGTPQFVKLSSDSFLLLWMKDGVLNYCKIDGSGTIDGTIHTMEGALSDCVPVVTNQKVIWYTWKNETNTFYTINLSNLSGSSVESVNGHQYEVTYATEDNSSATRTCKVCGESETFATMDSFNLWWVTGGSWYSYISSSQKEGSSYAVTLRSCSPSDAENKELVVTSSDESIAKVSGTSFTFVGTGNVTITIAAKYRPSVKINVTFTVTHNSTSKVLKEASCAEAGEAECTCSYCGKVYTETIEKLAHTYTNYTNATEDDNTAYRECSVCGEKESFTTMDSFSLWWWKGSSGSSYIYSSQKETATYRVSLRGYSPSDVDNKELVVTSSDESVATVSGTSFTFAGAGKVTITVSAKYRPSVKVTKTFTVSHDYVEDTDQYVAPTCSETGKKCYACSLCGGTKEETIAALGHEAVTDEAVAATCTKTGLTEGSHCSRCNEVLEKQETVAAFGHTVVTDEAVAATCTKTGLTKGSHCSRCNAVLEKQETVAALGHIVVTDEAVAATCTKTGLTEGSHCSRCNEVLEKQETVAAFGHTVVTDEAVAATCTKTGLTQGSHCSRCNAVLEKQETVAAFGHTVVTDEAVAATCTKTGLTEGSHCSRCNEVLKKQETVAALGHKVETDEAVAATCTKIGLTEGSHCSRCNEVFEKQETVAALGHTVVTDEAVAATCTKTGLTEGSHCSRCNEVFEKQDTVATLSHTPVTDEAVDPTCEKTGLTEGSHCSVCGEVLTAQETVPALGHTWDNGTVTKAATESAEGVRTYACSVCGKTKTAAIAQIVVTPDKAPASNPVSQDKSGTIGKSVTTTDKKITSTKSDEISGSVYQLLQLRWKKIAMTSLSIQWMKVPNATSYIVYGAKCGSKFTKLKTVKTTSYTQSKLKKGTYYKYFVVAVKGNVTMATSKTIHLATSGGKVGNDKSVKLNKTSVILSKGKKFTLKATVKPYAKKLKVKKHRAVNFESSNPSIATVSAKGVVLAKNKGTCYMYAYAQDGILAKAKITVK